MGLLDDVDLEELVGSNSYLEDTKKGLELIADLQAVGKNGSQVEEEFQKLEKLLEEDYLDLANQTDLPNEAKVYRQIIRIKDELEEMIKFPFLANKKIVALGGGFSAGKSKFINSILGEEVLPIDTRPTTSIPSYVVKGKEDKISTYNIFGQQTEIDREALQAITHAFYEEYNLSFTRILNNIILQDKELPYQNLAFLDTPGYTKAERHREEDNTDEAVARKHLRVADYLIWLVDIEKGTVPSQDIQFIKCLDFAKPIFVVFNKADKKTKEDVKSILEVAEQNLKEAGIEVAGVTAYSSLEGEEYFSNKLPSLLSELDKAGREVDLVEDLKESFQIYLDYLEESILKSSSNLESFNQLSLEFNLDSRKNNNLDNLIKEIQSKLAKSKKIKSRFERFSQKGVDLAKDILKDVEIAYFDKEEKGEELLLEIKKEVMGSMNETIERLIEQGVDLDKQDELGRTPLHWAVWTKDKKLLKVLIENGANNSINDNAGNKPLDIARKLNFQELFKLITGLLREEMVLVEGGSFERHGKEITLSSFAISKYQVTQKFYKEIMGENPSEFSAENRPVERVSWWDTIKFCNELSREEGLAVAYNLDSGDLLDANGNSTIDVTKVEGYRLPTEAEWEFAARGGNKSKGYEYAGSDNLDEVGWYDGNSDHETHPVGEKMANELGLYDMSGNVWEWCQDWYHNDRDDKESNMNPYMAKKGSCCVARGSSWNFSIYYCKLSYRYYDSPSYSNSYLGFRLTRMF